MTQPIDTAYVEIKPQTVNFKRDLKREVDRMLGDLEKDVSKSLRDVNRDIEREITATVHNVAGAARDSEREVTDALSGLNAYLDVELRRITQTTSHASRSASSQLAQGFIEAEQIVSEALNSINNSATNTNNHISVTLGRGVAKAVADMSKGLNQSQSHISMIFNSIAGGVTQLVGSFSTGTVVIIGALVGLLPVIIALSAALASLVGIVAALPAGLSLIGALVAPLVVGFSGFAAALKKSNTAGGAAVDTTHQIAMAERRLADAQRAARSAQESVNRARRQAQRDLEDLRFQLIRAAQDERGAELSILEAQKRVREARKSGDRLEKAEAQLALERAITARDEIHLQNQRLVADAKVTAKKGVEGSDQVTQALEAQRQATQSLTDARYQLEQARKPVGGGGGVDQQAAAMAALAPAARSVAQEFLSLESIFTNIKQRTQQALFAPLQGVLTQLAATVLPAVGDGMEKVAGKIGGFFAEIGKKLATPRGAEFFRKIFDTASEFIDRAGPGLLKFFEAVGRAIEEGLPFIERFGGFLGETLTKFADFITKSIEDGSFNEFFEQAVRTLESLGPLLKSVVGFIGELFTPQTMEAGRNLIDLFTIFFEILGGITKFFITDIPRAKEEFFLFLGKMFVDVKNWISNVPKLIDGAVGKIKAAGKRFIGGLFNGIKSGAGAIGDIAAGIGNAVKEQVNNVLRGVNSGIDIIDAVIPGSLPRIPMLAKGGMTTGPTLAGIGEAGTEAVIPLDDPRTIAALMNAGLGGGGDTIVFEPNAINITFTGVMPTEQEARRTGAAVGQGIINTLTARNIRTQVRIA